MDEHCTDKVIRLTVSLNMIYLIWSYHRCHVIRTGRCSTIGQTHDWCLEPEPFICSLIKSCWPLSIFYGKTQEAFLPLQTINSMGSDFGCLFHSIQYCIENEVKCTKRFVLLTRTIHVEETLVVGMHSVAMRILLIEDGWEVKATATASLQLVSYFVGWVSTTKEKKRHPTEIMR